MRSFVYPTRKNGVQVAALVLLAVALVIPQLAWADHASDHPYSQFDDPTINLPSEAHDALVEKYSTGELVYHAPGRRDDRLFSISPSEAFAALAEKYKTGKLVYHAPGRQDDRSFSTSASPEQIDAAFLAANPEVMVSRRYVAAQQEVAAATSSARWVALGKYYMEKSERIAAADSARWIALGSYYTARNAVFLTANPEIAAYRRFAAGVVQQTGAAFLAANPEVMVSRRYVAAQQEVAAATSSARWVALGKYYMEKSERAAAASSARWIGLGEYYADSNEVFLAENPEIIVSRRYVGQQDCSDLGLQC